MQPWDPQFLAIPISASAVVTSLSLWVIHKLRVGSYKKLANEILERAEKDAETMKQESTLAIRQKELDQQHEMDRRWDGERRKVQNEQQRLQDREDKLEERFSAIEAKQSDLERRERLIERVQKELELERNIQIKESEKMQLQLEELSGISSAEAEQRLLDAVRCDVQRDMARLTKRLIKETEEEAEERASRILATAINRLAVACVSDATITTVALPSEDLKGRIIGREGRNIRALERATGVNFMIDDTPGAVIVSGFDPVRRHVAKLALTELLLDGRIHPTRIEEVVEKARETVERQIRQHGEDAAMRAGVMDLHPEIILLLGKLKFRYSYGQNVLEHSLEVSHLLGMMAAELGLDIPFARRVGLMHDMGKAVTHEIEGTHAVIGHDLALKYGESPEVANGIGCHHGEMEPITIEGSLCGAADAISASRPGARIEAVEEYIKRLRKLEAIASEFPGIETAYALQAGREVRVAVMPDMIDDEGCLNLARDISQKIEKALSYPGSIKVTVIREKRAIQYAS